MAPSQYFDSNPSARSSPSEYTVALPDISFRITTDRGVFSHRSLDAGSRLLLMESPVPSANGAALDLGCGAGPLTVALAKRSPGVAVWAVDVNARARELCRANAAANDCPNVTVAAPEEVPNALTFTTIWSNPPIRIGKAALHALLQYWLARLDPGGEAILVVQRHLGADSLAAWMRTEGLTVERLRSRAGYRLLRVTGPARPTDIPIADP